MLVLPVSSQNIRKSPFFYSPKEKRTRTIKSNSDRLVLSKKYQTEEVSEEKPFSHENFVGFLEQRLKESKLLENCLMFLHCTGGLTSDDITGLAINAAGKIPKTDLDYCIEKKVPLTEVDTQEVLDIRQRNKNAKTIEKTDDLYIENHDAVLNHELDLLSKIPQERKMLIITGLSGAGKSTYLDSINTDEYYVADIDDIKKLFPEYETRKEDNTLHNISRSIMQEEIIPEVIKQGRNIAIPTTGLAEYVERLATPAKQNGYQVKLVHVKIDKEKAMHRVMDRYQREGRFIDPYFIATRAPYMDSELVCFENPELVDEVEVIEN